MRRNDRVPPFHFLLTLAAAFLMSSAGAEPAFPKPEEVLARVLSRTAELSRGHEKEGYVHQKLSISEQLDGKGVAKTHSERLYSVTYRGEHPVQRLLKVNGQAWTPLEQKEARPKRKGSGRQEEYRLNEELLRRFAFKVEARENWSGRPTLKISFRPARDDLPVNQLADRVLNKLQGTAWVDEADGELVKLKVGLGSKATLWGGLLGSLEKFDLTVERLRMPEGIWFTQRTLALVEGRKLFESMRWKTEEKASGFRRVTTAKAP